MNPRLRRHLRAGFIFAHDIVMAAVSFPLSLALRLGDDPLSYSPELVIFGTGSFTLVAALVLISMQFQREVWQYTSTPELLRVLRAVTLIILIFVLVQFSITRLELMPRSALIINWFVLAALLAGPRILYRIFRQKGVGGILAGQGGERVPVLLLGAGDGGAQFLRALSTDPAPRHQVVAIIDIKGTRVGRRIHGIAVNGTIDQIDDVMERLDGINLRPRRFIIAEEGVPGTLAAELLEHAERFGVSLARLPRITDFRAAGETAFEPRPIAIEDLLGRAQKVLDRGAMENMIRGRRVLVTGAGGTIGGELSRQIAALGPAHLTLLDHSEYALYSIDMEIAHQAPELSRSAVLANVRNATRIDEIVAEERPELVFHAAALKHVPMVEANPEEGVLTNAIGSRNVANACRAAGVGTMVLISTDKAVNPSSIMGATKRIAESYCQARNLAAATNGSAETRFITVRFGNVLGSTGSVVPLFQRQLSRGGPLTVTHPDMTRYFMTVREAVELVLEASVLGIPSDQGDAIYVLDMGEPVRIMDLAQQMIRLAGLRPGEDVKIEITGLRPGEKMHEELFHDAEVTAPTRYPGVLIAHPRALDLDTLVDGIDALEAAARRHDAGSARHLLATLVPDYTPPETPEQKRSPAP